MIEKLKEILAEYSEDGNTDITTETELKNDLGLNSLELAELACAVEDEFDIEITIDDMTEENFDSLEAICAMVARIQDED